MLEAVGDCLVERDLAGRVAQTVLPGDRAAPGDPAVFAGRVDRGLQVIPPTLSK